jgi:DNA-binding NarL/FixJ family response regulator
MKIVVIEDHQLVRDMFVVSCGNILAGAEVAGASDGSEGIRLCRRLVPDLVFLDLVLPDCDGIDLVADILKIVPGCRVIALTSHSDEFTLHRALRANVHGFIDKNEQPLGLLPEAIASVMAGRQYFSSVAQRLRASLRTDPTAFNKVLSDREQELLRLFGEGLDNEEIAARIELTPGTVKLHRRNIMTKLGIHSTPQLMRYAIEKGFTRLRRARDSGP